MCTDLWWKNIANTAMTENLAHNVFSNMYTLWD